MPLNVSPALGDRSLFPTLEPFAYLNHGAISPLSKPVVERITALAEDYAARGLGAFNRWRDVREQTRCLLASLLGTRAEHLAFVPNTSHGVLAIALCMPWKAGDRVICFEGEFPTNVTPWQRAAKLFDLQLDLLPQPYDAEGLERLEGALAKGVRLVALSAVQFQTGRRMPLQIVAERCRHHGAQLFIDGIQAVGISPLDVTSLGIDYLSCGSHKWLMGPEGVGVLYIAPHRVRELVPRVASWMSHEEAFSFLFEGPGQLRYDRPIRQSADFLEVGAPPNAAIAALEVSVGLIHTLGVQAIYDHVSTYLDALERGLEDMGFTSVRSRDPAQQSGSLCCLAPKGVRLSALASELGALGVSCSTPDGHLRFSPHWPNALEEVPAILDAVETVLDALAAHSRHAE